MLEIATAGGDGEASRKGKERAETTLEKMKAGDYTTGMPRLIELLELPEDVGKTFRKWLGMTAMPSSVAAGGGLPTILCAPGEIPRIADEAEAALIKAGAAIPHGDDRARIYARYPSSLELRKIC